MWEARVLLGRGSWRPGVPSLVQMINGFYAKVYKHRYANNVQSTAWAYRKLCYPIFMTFTQQLKLSKMVIFIKKKSSIILNFCTLLLFI